MKVFVPVIDSASHRYEIAGGFSQSCSVCIYDTSDNHVTWYDPSGLPVDFSEILEELKLNGVVNVIATAMQPMALKVLSNGGFRVYRSVGNDLLTNLELLKMRCLPLYGYEEALSEVHSFCATSCDSCSSVMCQN